MSNRWQLPSGITDLSPKHSDCLYRLSHQLISIYQQADCQYICLPIAEYTPNYLHKDKQVFLMPDIIDGQTLMVRSDMTPQIGRIDRKYAQAGIIGRYCYIADILQTQADDFYQSRNPIQAGVEIYGDTKHQADTLVINLMQKSLQILGFKVNELVLNIGHIGIFDALFKASLLTDDNKNVLTEIMRYRSLTDLTEFFNKNPVSNAQDFKTLLSLNGDVSVLTKAKKSYAHQQSVLIIIDYLEALLQLLPKELLIHIDLATLNDKAYYSGLLFAYYHQQFSKALAKGGRYDELNDRPATGFSLDLKFLSTKTGECFG